MSLNHRRRIFRPNAGGALPFRDRRLPSLGVLLAAAGCAATLAVATSLFFRSSEAPARAPASFHLTAPADRLAVLDGDTLRVGDQVVRLEGIVAPRRGSVCRVDTDCGAAAANALASLVRGRAVDCAIFGQDDKGRPTGSCVAGSTRLNEELVLQGWARAVAADLRQAETTARAAGRGIWREGS